jgi:hypothetical protein
MMHRAFVPVVLSIILAALVPATAYAQQASITGVVRDTSGAVLPGVIVEAASPALIEKVRSVISDSTGQYRIVDLRPGVYTVTFMLTGFSTVKREGIELTGSFTATVNADLRLGSLEETITVTGESPVVDVQSSKRQQVLPDELIQAIPTARVYHSLMGLIPGISLSGTSDVGGLGGPAVITFSVYGGRFSEGRLQLDGTSTGAAVGGSGTSYYVVDVGNAQEVTFSTSGGMGESETGGPLMNVVPRQGGNVRNGTIFANGASGAMQSSNFTQELQDAGLAAPGELQKIWDINGTFGGPLVRDRLWYVVTGRYQGNRKYVEGMYYNRNAGNPASWTYDPDLDRRATGDGTWKALGLRLTWQATPKHKFGVFWDETSVCVNCIGSGSSTISPEAAGTTMGFPHRVQQGSWTSPMTNRVLLEAGFGTYLSWYGGKEREGNNRDLIRVTEQAGIIPGLQYRSQDWSRPYSKTLTWRASVSYVTGAHSMKFGAIGNYYRNKTDSYTNNHRLAYRFNNGIPNQLTMSGLHFITDSHTQPTGFYAQEQWTGGRLTLQGGIRFDHVTSGFPDQQLGPEVFIPTPIFFPAQGGIEYNDISPRFGAAYDLRGDGKTAVKFTMGRYLEASSVAGIYSALTPITRLSTSTTRSWTDGNRNYVADCDLLNPAQQDFRSTGGDLCGAWATANFGQNVFTSSYDPELTQGWGVRPYNWDFGLSVTREVLPRVSLEVGYFRRIYGNFTVVDNRAVSAADYTPFSVFVPDDPRLPEGGGGVIGGYYDVVPNKFGQQDNLTTLARNYGKQTEHWNGLDINVNARTSNGIMIQGGVSTGRTSTNNCEVIAQVPEALFGATSFLVGNANSWLSSEWCDIQQPFLTQIRGAGAYTIPRIDVQVSATLQSKPGTQLAANYNVPSAVAAITLGRPLSGNAANTTVNISQPGKLYGDRINQLDIRMAKILRFGRTRTQVGLDVYNVTNSSAIQTYNQTYGARYLTPTLVLPARFAKVSAQFDF